MKARQLTLDRGPISVVPPNSRHLQPWRLKMVLYKRGNEIERLSRRPKGLRRLFSRFDKCDLKFIAFIYVASNSTTVLTGPSEALERHESLGEWE
jgi:hypothetical protein